MADGLYMLTIYVNVSNTGFGPLRSAEIFWEIRKYYTFRFIYSKQFKDI